MVVIDYNTKSISILGLSVPFKYQCNNYVHLMIDLQNVGYSVKCFAVEICSGAMVSDSNSKCLYAFYKSILGIKFTN